MVGALAAVGGLVGLAIGSFLNVVVHRVPRKESVVRPRSRCGSCGTEIQPRDNIPVLSWLLLRGRCRHCGTKIAARYPALELACGALWVLVIFRSGLDPEIPIFLVGFAGLLALTAIDLEHFLLPNRVLYPTLGAVIALEVLVAARTRDFAPLKSAAAGGAICFVVLYVIWFVAPRGMGFGDVRLAGLIGVLLGWRGVGEALLSIFLAFASASVVGVSLLLLRRRGRKDAIPFGPFLALGALLSFLFAEPILQWYLP